MTKFGDDKSPGTLLMTISSMGVESKEKVKYFNQIFLNMLNHIPTTSNPNDAVLMEFYTRDLLLSMAMWVKMVGKVTLTETFDEDIKVDKDM